jgi:hypothetical protein
MMHRRRKVILLIEVCAVSNYGNERIGSIFNTETTISEEKSINTIVNEAINNDTTIHVANNSAISKSISKSNSDGIASSENMQLMRAR